MRRRKPRRHIEIDANIYSGWLHRRNPADLLDVLRRSKGQQRNSEKREKRRTRRNRRGR